MNVHACKFCKCSQARQAAPSSPVDSLQRPARSHQYLGCHTHICCQSSVQAGHGCQDLNLVLLHLQTQHTPHNNSSATSSQVPHDDSALSTQLTTVLHPVLTRPSPTRTPPTLDSPTGPARPCPHTRRSTDAHLFPSAHLVLGIPGHPALLSMLPFSPHLHQHYVQLSPVPPHITPSPHPVPPGRVSWQARPASACSPPLCACRPPPGLT
jgi:hypothetical protein